MIALASVLTLTTLGVASDLPFKPPELRPLEPPPPSEFELSLKVDAPLLAGIAAAYGSAILINRARSDPEPTGDSAQVWSLDQFAIGRNSPDQDKVSTILQDVLVIGAPLGLALSEWNGSPKSLTPAIIVGESILASSALNQLTKSILRRPRPFTYANGSASGEADRSFYSGHTTMAFAAVTSSLIMLRELHPDSSAPLWLGALGLAGATTVGALRVTSGQHFPTDVLVGALTGIAVGWAVPMLHKKAPNLKLSVGASGVAIGGTFY
jgi:membrane-associated phospholipid phosphatase